MQGGGQYTHVAYCAAFHRMRVLSIFNWKIPAHATTNAETSLSPDPTVKIVFSIVCIILEAIYMPD